MAQIGAEMTFSSPRIDQVIVEIFFFGNTCYIIDLLLKSNKNI